MKFLAIFYSVVAVICMFSSIYIVKSDYALDNVIIHFDRIDVLLNGTYTRISAFGAMVNLTQIDSGWIQMGMTDANGNVIFSANSTGLYSINASLVGCLYTPRTITVNVTTINNYNDVFVKSGMFIVQRQITIFNQLQLVLPCSFGLTFPLSTDVNYTVESFGLRGKVEKGADYFTFSPLDSSEELNIINNTYFYPNYTIHMSFKTIEDGAAVVRIISGGKFLAEISPFYLIPKQAEADFTIIVHVARALVNDQITGVSTKLDELMGMMTILYNLVKFDVLGNITSIQGTLGSFVSTTFMNFTQGYSMSSLIAASQNGVDSINLMRSDLMSFRGSIIMEIQQALSGYLSDFRNTSYVLVVIVIAILMGTIINIVQRTENRKKTYNSQFVEGLKK